MGLETPCRNCKERHAGCHTECEKGIAWEKKHKEEKDRIDAIKEREYEIGGVKASCKERMVRSQRKRGQR